MRQGLGLAGAFDDLNAQVERLDAGRLPLPGQYAIALALVALALFARGLLDPLLQDRLPFLPVFAVLLILIVAVRPGPFVVAAIAGGLGTSFMFFPVRGSVELDAVGWASLGVYLFTILCAAVAAILVTRVRKQELVAHSAAAQQREALRVTLASIGDAVITTDEEGNVEFLNDVAVELTGWTREAAIGRPLTEVFRIISEETRQPVEDPVTRVIKLGQVAGLANHTILIHRDGSERAIDDSAAPIRDSSQRIVGVVLVFRDVAIRRETERRLVRSEHELADFFENATLPMHWIGPDGTILRANRAELKMLGYSAEEYVGHNISEFHVDASELGSIFRCLNNADSLHDFPARMRCRDGSERDVLISSSVYRENGRFSHTRCLTLDITDRKRAEQHLRESEERFRLMADAAPVLIWLSGPDKKRTWFNRTWLEFVGRTMDEELGYGWVENVHPDDRDECLRKYNEALDARRPLAMEYRLRNAKGGYRWILVSGVPRFAAEGAAFAGYIGSCVDIDDRKKIEVALALSESRFRRLADANLIGVGFGDGQGNVTYVNDEMLRMMGRSREDFEAGRVNWRQAIAPEYMETYRRTTEKLLKEGSVVGYEKAFMHPDGERTYFLGAAALLESGSNAHVRIALDLTKLKRSEHERELLVAQLRQADQRKDEFLAVLAHELRNPLAPIRNSLEVVKRSPADGDLLRPTIETMERQLNHMVRLIDDLFDVSRITHNRLELRRATCDLQSIIAQALQTIRPLADARRHTIEVRSPDELIVLDADAVRLTQVFINLLDNACKYTDPGGRVRLTAERDGQQVVVTVEDNGLGVSADMLPSIFDMFTRADHSLEREQGGLGLGLTLVKRMVELHGGTVSANSAGKGQGSRFTVRLPALSTDAAVVVHDPTPVTVPSGPYRILVVDDNRDASETLATLLRLTGHETRTAFDGKEAIAAAAQFRPDVVLLDIGLPRTNGYDVARHLRTQSWGRDAKLIALTGWGQDEDRRKSQEAGFDAHIVKPVDHAYLIQLLASLASKQQPVHARGGASAKSAH